MSPVILSDPNEKCDCFCSVVFESTTSFLAVCSCLRGYYSSLVVGCGEQLEAGMLLFIYRFVIDPFSRYILVCVFLSSLWVSRRAILFGCHTVVCVSMHVVITIIRFYRSLNLPCPTVPSVLCPVFLWFLCYYTPTSSLWIPLFL